MCFKRGFETYYPVTHAVDSQLSVFIRFRAASSAVLIATDVAARGLDIPSVEHVVHYQLPRSADVYVHRNGRTARAKREGFSLQLVGPEERTVAHALLISLERSELDVVFEAHIPSHDGSAAPI